MLPADRITSRAATAGSLMIGDHENPQAVRESFRRGLREMKRLRRARGGHLGMQLHAGRHDSGAVFLILLRRRWADSELWATADCAMRQRSACRAPHHQYQEQSIAELRGAVISRLLELPLLLLDIAFADY